MIRCSQEPERRAGFRAVLGVKTDAELGFRRPRRSRTIVRGVDRQHFIRAGLGVGAAAVAGPAALMELLAPTQPARIPSVVSMTHVAEVRAAAEAFAGWDARYGGGLMREAAVAQLRYCAELLNAGCPESIRGELLTAVGSFAETAGFMAVDDYAHDDARRMFRFAQSCAEEAGDWHLRAKVLKSLASQAICCGDPDDAVTFTESALVRADRLTATERAMLHTVRAHALGMLGRAEDAASAVRTADEEFSRACPAADPVWMTSYDAAHHQGETGRALWHAARHGQFVGAARDRLQHAVAEYIGSTVRARTRSQIKLASLVMVTGDPREAAALGTQALDWAGTLRSRRATDDLSDLRRLAQPHATLTEVVLDFGFARHTLLSGITVAGQPGTPGFLSPEHLNSYSGGPMPSSDVFCVGVLFFAAITGQLPIPWAGDDDDYLRRLAAVRLSADLATARPDLTQPQVATPVV